MLSIICGVRFDENNDDFSKTKTYSNLLDNDHVQNIGEHDFFKTMASNVINEKSNTINNLESELNKSQFFLEF